MNACSNKEPYLDTRRTYKQINTVVKFFVSSFHFLNGRNVGLIQGMRHSSGQLLDIAGGNELDGDGHNL